MGLITEGVEMLSNVEKLRRYADYLEAHPEIGELFDWDYPSNYHTASDWEEFQQLIRHLDGYTKDGYAGELSAEHREKDDDGNTIFRVTIHVRGVCESVPKVDEEGQPILKPVMKYERTETGEMEPEMEWKCPEVWSK